MPAPNGSRLSCGASAGGRKRPVLRYKRVGAQTHISSEGRPRQLQALVRQPLEFVELLVGHPRHGPIRVLVEAVHRDMMPERQKSRLHGAVKYDAKSAVVPGLDDRSNGGLSGVDSQLLPNRAHRWSRHSFQLGEGKPSQALAPFIDELLEGCQRARECTHEVVAA